MGGLILLIILGLLPLGGWFAASLFKLGPLARGGALKWASLGLALILGGGLVWLGSLKLAVKPVVKTVQFDYTGGLQYWTVPDGVTAALFTLYGGEGGDPCGTGNGGLGGRTIAAISVTPGQVLQIRVGGRGQKGKCLFEGVTASGGYNGGAAGQRGGGGGGGASDVRAAGYGLASRLIVAGGGGGSGVDSGGVDEGSVDGGGGGGEEGQTGLYGGALGGAGTQLSGGSAGGGPVGFGPGGNEGEAGTIGNGGGGAAGGTQGGGTGGGGGGGGWYGGGGGGGAPYPNGQYTQAVNSGGGGGGSGHAPGVRGPSTFATGVWFGGHGQILITFTQYVPLFS